MTEEAKADYSIDLTQIPTNAEIIELTQAGNWLCGVTSTGVRFRQRVPAGKVLNKVNDKYVIEDMEIAHS